MKNKVLTVLISLLITTTNVTFGQEIHTLTPGILTVAVTTEAPENEFDPQLWIRQYIEKFADEYELSVSWVVVPFDESWLLASSDEVDLVATNVASFPDRANPGASFSDPFLYERRALRIKASDHGKFKTLNDFIGKKVGAVAGMAAERDLLNRAIKGVVIEITDTLRELYDKFDEGRLDAIAEAEYYSLSDEVIPSHDSSVVLIDHHDLIPGEREESVFVVSNNSGNLLHTINLFIKETKFPISK